ncbi:MAG TPA: cold shock domain-containing protein [Chitinophagaceae bacterium]|jgi:cold shock CspA family protein|nr:cold shock domain-containing protein [Chitinophagaceae bacterium]
MAKSKESFNKREKEKKRQKQAQDKREKREERKANAGKGKSLNDMMAYIDENGNISATPPDPSKKIEINVEDIPIGVPRYEEEEEEGPRQGVVSFFNESKGFGFIQDARSGERVFVHVQQLTERLFENDKVTFEVESTPRGLSAINVKKI